MPVTKITDKKPEIGYQVLAKLLLGDAVKYSVGVRESEIGYKCNFTGFYPVCPILEWVYTSDIQGSIDYHRVNLSDPISVAYAFINEKNGTWVHGTESKTFPYKEKSKSYNPNDAIFIVNGVRVAEGDSVQIRLSGRVSPKIISCTITDDLAKEKSQ